MKVIDLLNKIAKGEKVPKKIHHQYYEYKWNAIDNDYQKSNGEMLLGNMHIQYHLNDEVEILEDKTEEIEEVDWKDVGYVIGKIYKEFRNGFEEGYTSKETNCMTD